MCKFGVISEKEIEEITCKFDKSKDIYVIMYINNLHM